MEASANARKLKPITGTKNESTKRKNLNQRYLINKLNFINFQDETILINLKHPRYQNTISLQARPQPCHDEELHCTWVEKKGLRQKLKSHSFENLLISDGSKLLQIEPQVIELNDKGARFRLPNQCREVSSRKVWRHFCEDISVQLVQNSSVFSGKLLDFNAVSFSIELSASPPQTFQWLTHSSAVNITLQNNSRIVFSGSCGIIKFSGGQNKRRYVVQPLFQKTTRFKPKKYRSTRLELTPSPNLVFKHPITGQMVDLKVMDLSGSGCSVQEEHRDSVLLPGMIIPELSFNFANSFKITGKGQVVYRNMTTRDSDDTRIKCGIALLDMPINDHVKLLGFLQQAKNEHSYICKQVDLDALWNFFFETGFIYPEKYAFIQANKHKLKSIYKKLYTESPTIARHFIYQEHGVIQGHMAMLRVYENSWMIHHHAAGRNESNRAGLMVLSQISRYVNDLHNLYSARLNYVFCYFRPQNRFPRRVFGGVANYIDNQKACSTDTFAYYHFQREQQQGWHMPESWSLNRASATDLEELETFYTYESGGLMVHALDLEPETFERSDIQNEYKNLGFKKERQIFCLKYRDDLKALIIMNNSDIGLNMSDLTNCFKVIILDQDHLNKSILHKALGLVSTIFDQDKIPVLLYPQSFAAANDIPTNKSYTLWVLDLHYLDLYFKYCDTLLRKI